eukprot:TRINITY_DN4832_c0_g1_i1.p1 TRINITY_DN4832_c0_g1~~TRINITY_DN4832_c0_g1_i1.p1  ORF type:complete len:555 (+),score=166.22 TRINITY_DN4832_c0_g1_i1:49-1665(+)
MSGRPTADASQKAASAQGAASGQQTSQVAATAPQPSAAGEDEWADYVAKMRVAGGQQAQQQGYGILYPTGVFMQPGGFVGRGGPPAFLPYQGVFPGGLYMTGVGGQASMAGPFSAPDGVYVGDADEALAAIDRLRVGDDESAQQRPRKQKQRREDQPATGDKLQREPRPRKERVQKQQQLQPALVPAQEQQPRQPRPAKEPRQQKERQPQEQREQREPRQPRERKQPAEPRQPREAKPQQQQAAPAISGEAAVGDQKPKRREPKPRIPKGDAGTTVAPATGQAASAEGAEKKPRRERQRPTHEEQQPQRIVDEATAALPFRERFGELITSMPHLADLESDTFDAAPKYARVFVIKSFSGDDVHKCIKFGVWASTDSGNKRLNAAFEEAGSQGPVYLAFSVNGSGHFCGLAQMTSAVDFGKKLDVWAQDKWKGAFRVRWLFIKDIPNSAVRHITLPNNENKPVSNSRDTTEVLLPQAHQLLQIFEGFRTRTSMLDQLGFYDRRAKTVAEKRTQRDGDAAAAPAAAQPSEAAAPVAEEAR